MTNMDYRDMADEIRSLVPLLIHPQAVADLRLLANRYERLAEYLQVLPRATPGTQLEDHSRAS
jgi:hypothetical protein